MVDVKRGAVEPAGKVCGGSPGWSGNIGGVEKLKESHSCDGTLGEDAIGQSMVGREAQHLSEVKRSKVVTGGVRGGGEESHWGRRRSDVQAGKAGGVVAFGTRGGEETEKLTPLQTVEGEGIGQ